MKYILFVWTFVLFLADVQAQSTPLHLQTKNNNVWFMYFGNHKIGNKLGIHLEAQLRRNELVSKPQQLLIRTGFNYYLNSQIMITTGYCFVETYPYGNFPVKAKYAEHRIWEQLQFKNEYGRLEWVNRFRLEQRFSKLPVLNNNNGTYESGDAVYTNRFRSLHRVSLPLKGKVIQDKSVYISAYNEIFINFGKKVAANLFDQNRAYLALGYKIPKVGRLEVGYLYQAILKGDGIKIENNHTLQFGLNSTLNFYNPRKI
jgi:hypothetical protein